MFAISFNSSFNHYIFYDVPITFNSYSLQISQSHTMIELALEGLSYYHTYDRLYFGWVGSWRSLLLPHLWQTLLRVSWLLKVSPTTTPMTDSTLGELVLEGLSYYHTYDRLYFGWVGSRRSLLLPHLWQTLLRVSWLLKVSPTTTPMTDSTLGELALEGLSYYHTYERLYFGWVGSRRSLLLPHLWQTLLWVSWLLKVSPTTTPVTDSTSGESLLLPHLWQTLLRVSLSYYHTYDRLYFGWVGSWRSLLLPHLWQTLLWVSWLLKVSPTTTPMTDSTLGELALEGLSYYHTYDRLYFGWVGSRRSLLLPYLWQTLLWVSWLLKVSPTTTPVTDSTSGDSLLLPHLWQTLLRVSLSYYHTYDRETLLWVSWLLKVSPTTTPVTDSTSGESLLLPHLWQTLLWVSWLLKVSPTTTPMTDSTLGKLALEGLSYYHTCDRLYFGWVSPTTTPMTDSTSGELALEGLSYYHTYDWLYFGWVSPTTTPMTDSTLGELALEGLSHYHTYDRLYFG